MSAEVFVVTGAARGIGRATAIRLRSTGAVIAILDRNLSEAEDVARTIGGRAYGLDIAQESEVEQVVAAVEADLGPITRLVNCAGPLQNTDRPEALSMRIWDRMTDVHLRGTYLMTVAVGSRMAARGKGSIVTIASVVGIRAGPLHAYGPAKAALINLTEGLAAEWGPRGVRLNCVAPGFVRTPGTEKGFSEQTIDAVRLERCSALRRLVQVDEVVAAIEFLLLDGASAITGCTLPVDAGFLVSSGWGAYGDRPDLI